MEKIFADFEIVKLMKDPFEPGVFVKARKPINFKSVDLSDIALYSMIIGKRTKEFPENFPFLRSFRIKLGQGIGRLASFFFSKLVLK
jgi:hypothetical protein